MLNHQIRQFAGRAGILAGRALSQIRDVERTVSRFDQHTGGVLGDLYRLSPAAPLYNMYVAPTKVALRTIERVGAAAQARGPGVLGKAALDLVHPDDPILRPAGMAVNPIYKFAQSPALSKYAY